jgi:hypothetical protein
MKVLFRIVSVALLASALSAQSTTGNLLLNPSAESGVSHWTDPLGNGFQSVHMTTLTYVGVVEGSYAFWAGNSGPTGPLDHELRQDVDVSSHAAEIDGGDVRWFMSTYIYSRDHQGVRSVGGVTVELLDSGGVLLDSYSTPRPTGFGAYGNHRNSQLVLPGTRTLRYRMQAHRDAGDVTDALFDLQDLQLFFPPEVYCTAMVNSLGCTPSIGFSQWPDNFHLTATNVRNNKPGIFFWGLGSTALPFYGGTLCVQPPLVRTPVQYSGGNVGVDDCSGSYSFHFTGAYASQYSLSHGVTRGITLFGQFWSRDPVPGNPGGIGLTDAIHWAADY